MHAWYSLYSKSTINVSIATVTSQLLHLKLWQIGNIDRSELKLPVQRIIKYIKKVIQMKKKLFIPVLNVCNFLLTFWITINFSKRNFSWSLKWNKVNKPKAFIVYNETIDLYWKTHICTIFILTGNSSLILFDASSNTGVKIWLNLHLK